MLSLLRRWILPSPSSSQSAIHNFFSPHYAPSLSTSARLSHFSTFPPLHSDNKPSNPPGTKPSKPAPPPATPAQAAAPSTPPVAADKPYKPPVTPAWHELMSILSQHVYDSAWTPEAQARYAHILKQYPYISPETQYSTALPIPSGMTPREACQSAAEEALFADYRPLRAGFVEDYTEQNMEEGVVFDFGPGVMTFPVSRSQILEVIKNVAARNEEDAGGKVMELISTKRRRYTKMKNHKRRKL